MIQTTELMLRANETFKRMTELTTLFLKNHECCAPEGVSPTANAALQELTEELDSTAAEMERIIEGLDRELYLFWLMSIPEDSAFLTARKDSLFMLSSCGAESHEDTRID